MDDWLVGRLVGSLFFKYQHDITEFALTLIQCLTLWLMTEK